MKILVAKGFRKLTSTGLLAVELRRLGHDVHVLVPELAAAEQQDMSLHDIPLHCVALAQPWTANMYRSVFDFVLLLWRERFDIIHLNLAQARFYGRLASLFAPRTKVVSTIRGFENRYERWSNWRDSYTVSVSHCVKDFLVSGGLSEKKVVVIQNALELEEFDGTPPVQLHDELGVKNDVRLVGMVAFFRAHRKKGHHIFFEAALELIERYSDVNFVLVGSSLQDHGYNEAFFKNYVEELGVAQRFHFLGGRDDVPGLMKALNVHVLPSYSEGCPMAVLEAAAAGVPNAGTNIPAIVELGLPGLFVPPGDHEGLADSVSRLLEDKELADRISVEARRVVEDRFESKKMGEAYEQLFRDVLEVR